MSILNGTTAAPLFVGMYLMQGLGCLLATCQTTTTDSSSKNKKNKNKKSSSDICFVSLLQSINMSFGSIIVATAIAGLSMLYLNWNVQLALGLAQSFTCITQLINIVMYNGRKSSQGAVKSIMSDKEVNSEWMSLLLTALPAYACLTNQGHALDWTRIVAASWFWNGLQNILDPSKGIASFAENRGFIDASTSWIITSPSTTSSSKSSSSLLPTTSKEQQKQQSHHRHVLTMFSTLSLWQLNYSTVMFCLAQGLCPSKAIGCGSIFGFLQLLSSLSIVHTIENEDMECLRDLESNDTNNCDDDATVDLTNNVPSSVYDAFALILAAMLFIMLFL